VVQFISSQFCFFILFLGLVHGLHHLHNWIKNLLSADLEAAAKARSKLSSSLSSLPAEDVAAISALHDQLIDLEGVSSHLPAIVSRLGELSELHSQAADFSTRLSAVEGAANETERLLRGVEEAIEGVEGGWKSNLEAIERSVAKIDERVGSLSG